MHCSNCFRFAGLFLVVLAFTGTWQIAAAETLELRDGERVVLVGGTLIEREQRDGYWEAMLTSRYPDRNITFRNLGWSGDTVWGESRAGFGTPADGYKALLEHVTALKPTVIIVCYGFNESFAGKPGLAKFIEGFESLTKALAATKARIAVLAPLRMEAVDPPLPSASAVNDNLWHYVDAMHEVATARDYISLDLYKWLQRYQTGDKPLRLTDNGIHLTPMGYWVTAGMLENDLQFSPSGWRLDIDAAGKVVRQDGNTLSEINAGPDGATFTLTSRVLPVTAALREPGHSASLRVACLKPGDYELLVDGVRIAQASHEQWAGLVGIDDPHELHQVEQLRAAIMLKNELYFHRWRPQNVTYLFGFRKHEQGNNAAEIPKFDPLIAEQEAKIAELRVPKPHKFVLKKVQ